MSLADALLSAPAAGVARGALAEEEEAWIVGGAIRDAIRGRPVVDLDLAVSGDGRHPRGRRREQRVGDAHDRVYSRGTRAAIAVVTS